MGPDRLTRLSQQLAYTFTNIDLLKIALTHRSYGEEHNERLEFLGDAIVNFIIGEALFERYPKRREGELSHLRASLVCGETLAELARELHIGDYLRLGVGEQKTGGDDRTSILADTVEAIIAGVYLDGGMDVCRQLVLQWYNDRLTDEAVQHYAKDAKTQLQEYLQAQQFSLPVYSVEHIEGDMHEQTFHIICQVSELNFSAQGTGTSRRRAEQDAAKHFLATIKMS